MDNATHTLAGALVAQAVAHSWPVVPGGLDPERRRRLLGWILVLGSNLPDLDFVYSGLTGGKLGYLMHHRGHTHTVVGALVAAALLAAATELWARRRANGWGAADRLLLLAMCCLGPLLHIAMDFTNNYGVHPFWPVYDGWFYGDSVFIAEPLFWASAAPLVFLARTLPGRVLTAITLGVGLVLTWAVEWVPSFFAAVVTVLLLALLWVGWRKAPRRAALAGVACWAAVTLLFAVASWRARASVDVSARASSPGATTLDRALTPFPANPLCWSVLLVQTEGSSYRVRSGTLSILPGLLPAVACPSPPAWPTAPLVPSPLTASPALVWRDELSLPVAELRRLNATHCEVAAFLRFARVPWFTRHRERLIIGDLRYDREHELGFAELELQVNPPACPRFVPPWIPPRSDVLEGARE